MCCPPGTYRGLSWVSPAARSRLGICRLAGSDKKVPVKSVALSPASVSSVKLWLLIQIHEASWEPSWLPRMLSLQPGLSLVPSASQLAVRPLDDVHDDFFNEPVLGPMARQGVKEYPDCPARLGVAADAGTIVPANVVPTHVPSRARVVSSLRVVVIAMGLLLGTLRLMPAEEDSALTSPPALGIHNTRTKEPQQRRRDHSALRVCLSRDTGRGG